MQSKCEEINSSEPVRIYHHELHSKHIKRSSILKLEADGVVYEGHTACAQYLEQTVGQLLLKPAVLDNASQLELLQEVDVSTMESTKQEMQLQSQEKEKWG